jgi:hypothetical protein
MLRYSGQRARLIYALLVANLAPASVAFILSIHRINLPVRGWAEYLPSLHSPYRYEPFPHNGDKTTMSKRQSPRPQHQGTQGNASGCMATSIDLFLTRNHSSHQSQIQRNGHSNESLLSRSLLTPRAKARLLTTLHVHLSPMSSCPKLSSLRDAPRLPCLL